MSQPFKLYRLQQIDSQLDQALSRLLEIESALKDDAKLREAQKLAETAAETLQEARKALRQAERNVQDQHHKIEQSEATLYSGKVKNPKELQDIQNEAASLKRYLIVLEDRQLDAMIFVDESEKENNDASSYLRSVQTEIAQKNANLVKEKSGLLKEAERFETERDAAITNIPTEDLDLFEKLRHQRSGVAVAKVTDKSCMACGTTLSAVLLQAARSPNQITRCATCKRILYLG